MLRATELGLDTHPIGGWDEDKVKKSLKIPNENHVVFILAMGKKGSPDKLNVNLKERHDKERTRNPNEENFSFDIWKFN